MHHANIIINKEDCKNFVFSILKKNLDFEIKANPDFLMIEPESFGIDDARDLEKWAMGKPLLGDAKVCLIIAKSITFEAQNALLKVLEEPPLGTYIFINMESLDGLLPTFISRIRILNAPKNNAEENVGAHKFFHSKVKERLSFICALSKKEDKNNMKELIKDLEQVAYKNSSKNMKDILTAKIFASARGSSPKMLLEWLSCVL